METIEKTKESEKMLCEILSDIGYDQSKYRSIVAKWKGNKLKTLKLRSKKVRYQIEEYSERTNAAKIVKEVETLEEAKEQKDAYEMNESMSRRQLGYRYYKIIDTHKE